MEREVDLLVAGGRFFLAVAVVEHQRSTNNDNNDSLNTVDIMVAVLTWDLDKKNDDGRLMVEESY
jgi:hypothetical protein